MSAGAVTRHTDSYGLAAVLRAPAEAVPDDVFPAIPARELQRGDYLCFTRENGKSGGGSSYVERVTREAGTVFVTVWTGTYPYPENEIVTIHPR